MHPYNVTNQSQRNYNMTDLNNNTKKFKLPAYIQTPFFLYQDDRLDKSALLIASFFYSLITSGLKITASTDYLCALAKIKKRQVYKIMNDLEEFRYIRRTGFTNRKKIHWVYNPNFSLTVVELDTSAPECISEQKPNTSALQDTKLVHSSALDWCTPVHQLEELPLYDTKEDTKEYKTTTTQNSDLSSSSFFSLKQKEQLLSLKLPSDSRTNQSFLEHCQSHVENQDNDKSTYQRVAGLKTILNNLWETGEHFKAKCIALVEAKKVETLEERAKRYAKEAMEWKNDRRQG